MRKHLSLLLAVALLVAPIKAAAQQFPTVPSGTVIGRTLSGTGPSQAIPFATLIASMLASSPTIPTINTSTILFAGSNSGTATLKAQATAGTPTVQLPNTSGTLFDGATLPLVGNATTGNVSCPACALGVATRAAAAGIDLSAYSYVRTGGYAAVGDGGGALFKNVGTAAFLDTYIDQIGTPPTRVSGSGYVNATYNHVFLTGGNGMFCPVTIVVSGGGVASVSMSVPCVGYTVGDVLTTANSNLGGSGSGFTWTVNAVIGPKASFTDFAGNHWQYLIDAGNYINTRQFGAKLDWTFQGGDAAATDDSTAIQSAIAFASRNPGVNEAPNAGTQGDVVISPKGISKVCSFSISSFQGIVIPEVVRVSGNGPGSSAWIECSSASTTHFVVGCNPNSTFGEYACSMDHMQLLSEVASAGASTALFFSNSGQQFPLLDTVEMNPKSRGCIKYDIGRGGAANAIFNNIDCEQGAFSGTPTNHGVVIPSTVGGTQVKFINFVYGCTTAACTSANVDAFQVAGGDFILESANIEGAGVGISLGTASTSVQNTIKNVTYTANSGQTGYVVNLTSANHAGNTLFENIQPGNASKTILNQQTAGPGVDFTGVILKQITCVSGACN